MPRMLFGGAVVGIALALAASSAMHAGPPGGEVSFSNGAGGKLHQKKKHKKRRQKFARRKNSRR